MTEEIKDQEEKKEQEKAVEPATAEKETSSNEKNYSPDTDRKKEETGRQDYKREPRDNPRHSRDSRGGSDHRFPKFRKKICKFCYDSKMEIDYKRSDVLERFITDRGKILPRRVTGTCARHQRRLAVEIKKARTIALLPFVEK